MASPYAGEIIRSILTTPACCRVLSLVAQGKLSPEMFVSHRFKLDEMMDAYDTFGRAAEAKAMKVAISR